MRAVVTTEAVPPDTSCSCSLFVGTVSHLPVPLSSGTEWRGMQILGDCNHCLGQRVNGQGCYKSNSKIQRTLRKQVNWVSCNPDSKLEEQSNLVYKTQHVPVLLYLEDTASLESATTFGSHNHSTSSSQTSLSLEGGLINTLHLWLNTPKSHCLHIVQMCLC